MCLPAVIRDIRLLQIDGQWNLLARVERDLMANAARGHQCHGGGQRDQRDQRDQRTRMKVALKPPNVQHI